MSDSLPRSPADHAGWTLFGTSVRGASHEASGLANQDAYGWPAPDGLAHPIGVVAVADGHGHYRHFRAQRGAELAVEEACRRTEDLAPQFEALDASPALGEFAKATFVPALVDGWRNAVAADHTARRFNKDEEAIRAEGDDDPVMAYGSTLLIGILAARWVVVAQIGDGDVVALLADGGVITPVPDDPTLDGRYTTSLCQSSAVGSFRIAVIDRSSIPIRALLMATDGYGNAQTADPWPTAVGRDVMSLLDEHGEDWVGAQLPTWAARCASTDGSGDDTTVVLAVAGS